MKTIGNHIYPNLRRFAWSALLCLAIFQYFVWRMRDYIGGLSGSELTSFRFLLVTCIFILPMFVIGWLLTNQAALGKALFHTTDAPQQQMRSRYIRIIAGSVLVHLLICLGFLFAETSAPLPPPVFEWVQLASILFAFYQVVTGHAILRLKVGARRRQSAKTGAERIRQRRIFRRLGWSCFGLFAAYLAWNFVLIRGVRAAGSLTVSDSLFVLLNTAFTLFIALILLKMSLKIDHPDVKAGLRKEQLPDPFMAGSYDDESTGSDEDFLLPKPDPQPSLRLTDIVGLAMVVFVWLLIPFFRPHDNRPENGTAVKPRTEQQRPLQKPVITTRTTPGDAK